MNKTISLSLMLLGVFMTDMQAKQIESSIATNEIGQNYQNNQILLNETTEYFVRPSGLTYGTGDGLSYANAWSGGSNINWSLVEGNVLNICGEHFEMLVVESNNVIIIGNNINESGSINGSINSLNTGMRVSSKQGVVINNLTVSNCNVQCLFIQGNAEVTTNDCIFTNSNNQAIQHFNTASAVHNNVTCSNNIDDGISQHDSTSVIINGGIFSNNESGVNTVGGCTTVINGSPTFSGNIYDIWAANATIDESCIITAYDCTFPNQVYASNGGKVVLNNCFANAVSLTKNNLKGYLEANTSVISSLKVAAGNRAILNNCSINDLDSVSNGSVIDAIDSYIRPIGVFDLNSGSEFRLLRTFFDGTNCSDHMVDVANESTIKVVNSIFYNPPSSKYAVVFRSGSIVEAFDNVNIIGVNNSGRGLLSQINLNVRNTIIAGLQQVVNVSNGFTVTFENCTLYNNTTNLSGTGNLTEVSVVNFNPVFINEALLDFRISNISPCIGLGLALPTNNEVIKAANWNIQPPSITKELQTGTWDIGAYSFNPVFVPSTQVSTLCGQTLQNINANVYLDYVYNATEYLFSITNLTTNVEQVITSPNRFFYFKDLGSYNFDTSYSVKGRAIVDGYYSEFGPACTVTTPATPPSSQLRDAYCNATLANIYDNIYAKVVVGASIYKFKIVNNGAVQEIERQDSRFSFAFAEGITVGTTYGVSVSVFLNGVWSAYGNVCNITTPATWPTSQLRPAFCNGAVSAINSNFYAVFRVGATAYRFKTIVNGQEVIVDRPDSRCFMSAFAGAMTDQTYSIQVAVQIGGAWSEFGNACNLTVGTIGVSKQDTSVLTQTFDIKAYPNPFVNQITLSLANENVKSNIMVYDMTGKRIQQLSTERTTLEIGNDWSNGIYLIQIVQGQEVKNIRVVKQ